MLRNLLYPASLSIDWAALLLRIVFCSLMVYNHGTMKLALFGEDPASFPDAVGLGSTASYYFVVFAEAICSVLVLFGVFTRLALIPLLVTMAVAAFSVNWDNPLTDKELPLLYFSVYAAIFLLGPGRFSLDVWFFKGRMAAPAMTMQGIRLVKKN